MCSYIFGQMYIYAFEHLSSRMLWSRDFSCFMRLFPKDVLYVSLEFCSLVIIPTDTRKTFPVVFHVFQGNKPHAVE